MAVLPPWSPEIEVSGAEEAFLPPKLFRDIIPDVTTLRSLDALRSLRW